MDLRHRAVDPPAAAHLAPMKHKTGHDGGKVHGGWFQRYVDHIDQSRSVNPRIDHHKRILFNSIISVNTEIIEFRPK
jgi:hypothetical protein